MSLPATLLDLVALAFAGRVWLAILPAGRPGGHGLRDLPATWGTSHALGTAIYAFQAALAARLGWTPHLGVIWIPTAIALLLRLATLPGALVPRHLPRQERPSRLAHCAQLALCAALALALRAAEDVRSAADVFALVAIASYGWRATRRAPAARSLLAALAITPFAWRAAWPQTETREALLLAGAAAAFALPWLRVADRRGLALAVLCCAGFALIGWTALLLSALGLTTVVALTARPSRKLALQWSVCALAAGGLLISGGGLEGNSPVSTLLLWSLAPTLIIVGGSFLLRVERSELPA